MKPTLSRPVSVTPAELNGSVTLENTDAGTNGKAVGARRDIQDEAERSRTRRGDAIEGKRPSALAHGQLTTRADKKRSARCRDRRRRT